MQTLQSILIRDFDFALAKMFAQKNLHPLYALCAIRFLQFWRNRCGSNPFAEWLQASTFRAGRGGVLNSAVGANALRLERVKRFPAFAAYPQCALGRRDFAYWTGKAVAARYFSDADQGTRLHQTAPTIQQDKRRDGSKPDGLHFVRRNEIK